MFGLDEAAVREISKIMRPLKLRFTCRRNRIAFCYSLRTGIAPQGSGYNLASQLRFRRLYLRISLCKHRYITASRNMHGEFFVLTLGCEEVIQPFAQHTRIVANDIVIACVVTFHAAEDMKANLLL